MTVHLTSASVPYSNRLSTKNFRRSPGAETHLPFGGVRRTGNGHREGTAEGALEVFSEWKIVYVAYSGKLQKAQIDNN